MNAINSVVASSAAKIRSPSFSRSSSSTTTTGLPDLMSRIARSMGSSGTLTLHLHQSRDVFREDVDLHIHLVTGSLAAQGRRPQGFWDQAHLEPVGADC